MIMKMINITQYQLDEIKRKQELLSKIPTSTFAKLTNNFNNVGTLTTLGTMPNTTASIMQSIKIKQSELSQFGTFMNKVNKNNPMFKGNLFSEKVLNNFIKSTSFPKKDVLEMSYALRNLNVNVTTSSTFTESIDSTNPIDKPKENRNTDEFQRIVHDNVVTPSNELVNASSKTIFVETIADFVLRLMHQDPVNTNIYIWVLFFSYFGYCLTHEKDDI